MLSKYYNKHNLILKHQKISSSAFSWEKHLSKWWLKISVELKKKEKTSRILFHNSHVKKCSTEIIRKWSYSRGWVGESQIFSKYQKQVRWFLELLRTENKPEMSLFSASLWWFTHILKIQYNPDHLYQQNKWKGDNNVWRCERAWRVTKKNKNG